MGTVVAFPLNQATCTRLSFWIAGLWKYLPVLSNVSHFPKDKDFIALAGEYPDYEIYIFPFSGRKHVVGTH